MGKAILMSIRPQYVAKILNGVKTIEVRKKFPKDYVGWVYIYCTKKYKITQANNGEYVTEYDKNYRINSRFSIDGYVVARFWCDKVEIIEYCGMCYMVGDIANTNRVANKSCLDFADIKRYLGNKNGYAIHISKLEVFDKPMLTTMFRKPKFNKIIFDINHNRLPLLERLRKYSIRNAPQSWCYIDE